jgi:hemerythrin
MNIEWQEQLSVGVAEIDNQHRQLFDSFNAFMAACESEQGIDEVNSLFGFLSAYMVTHFADEEQLQKCIGFPDYPKHQKQHQEFTRKIAEHQDRLNSEGPSYNLVFTVAMTITDWLIDHISRMDKAIGQYMEEQEKGKAYTGQ